MPPKFKRGDRVELTFALTARFVEKYPSSWYDRLCSLQGSCAPFWVPLRGWSEKSGPVHEGTLGTVLGYDKWLGISLVKVNIADTQVHLFSEEVLEHL